MRKILLILFCFLYSQPDQIVTGYLRQAEMSFCMDECGQFYLETYGDMYWPVLFDDSLENIHLYLNRYVDLGIGEEISCTECSAFQVETISLSEECFLIVDCFEDPCFTADDCLLNTPVECISNYCGGCYADFYDLGGNLVDCYGAVNDCEDGEINNENPCNPSECWNGQWYEIIIDCAEQMGVPCEGGVYIEPSEGECCSECISYGDINLDNQIDILDIVTIVNFILMNDDLTDSEFTISDINTDGYVNVLDIISIIQLILNQPY